MLHAVDSPENVTKEAYQANINALMIFTSQEGLNSGHYRFKNIGVKMDIYHLPFMVHLDSHQENLNYFIVGNVGYSRATLDENVQVETTANQLQTIDYDTKFQTFTGGIGGGVRYRAPYDIDFLAGIELIYSRTGTNVYSADDQVDNEVLDVLNTHFNDNLTYKLFTQIEYHGRFYDFTPYAKASYKLYETTSDFEVRSLGSFSTQAHVTSAGVGFETPPLVSYEEMYLTFEAYTYAHYLGGDVPDVIGFDTYGTLGAVAYWYTEAKPDWAERFFIEASTVRSGGLEGYNLGIGFTLEY